MNQEPLATFITLNYKTPHHVRHLLRGIERAQWPFPFEYFLVDNASGDGTLEMVAEKFPWVKTIPVSTNIGFGAANNLALKRAQGKYVVLLNPDSMVFPLEVERWIQWMDEHPRVGISGPRIVHPDGSDQFSCFRFYRFMTPFYRRTILGRTPWGKRGLEFFLMQDMDRSCEQEVDWVQASVMCVRRSLLDKIGHFDERFFMYFEDTDLCRRTWEAGFCVTYTPVARFTHYYNRESRIRHFWQIFTNKLTRIHLMSALKFFLKYCRRPHPRKASSLSSLVVPAERGIIQSSS